MSMYRRWVVCLGLAFWGLADFSGHVLAEENFPSPEATLSAPASMNVAVETISDLKAVFATVESSDVVLARARIAGTIALLNVDEGDAVEAGAIIAVVVDDRLVPQVRALDAQVAALQAEAIQAISDRDRAKELLERGVIAKARFDEAQTRVNVVTGRLDAARQERKVVVQQQEEGKVLAPTTGVVLDVETTQGSVVFAGEPVARIASENYILRLRLPERHAQYLREGDEVRVDQAVLGPSGAAMGEIRKIYPQIVDGRVVADAVVEGLGGYFVGERIRVWVSAGDRKAMLVPPEFILTLYGVDYVLVSQDNQKQQRVAVQRGRTHSDGRIEILSGLNVDDVIYLP